jgi:hypothetical protein
MLIKDEGLVLVSPLESEAADVAAGELYGTIIVGMLAGIDAVEGITMRVEEDVVTYALVSASSVLDGMDVEVGEAQTR